MEERLQLTYLDHPLIGGYRLAMIVCPCRSPWLALYGAVWLKINRGQIP